MWNLIKRCVKFWYIAKVADRITTQELQIKPEMEWDAAVHLCTNMLVAELNCDRKIAEREIIAQLMPKMENNPVKKHKKEEWLKEAKEHEREWKLWNPKTEQHRADYGVYS